MNHEACIMEHKLLNIADKKSSWYFTMSFCF